MMLGWMKEQDLVDYYSHSGSPSRWQVYLVGNYSHIGDPKSTHAYLSGITDLMHINEYVKRSTR